MRNNPSINLVESRQLKTKLPVFSAGDLVAVSVRVREGERERIQIFQGIVLAVRNRGLNSSFIVHKQSYGVGVERTFQLHSPLIQGIEVKRRGDVRKSKIYYLRERSGRSARIRERLKLRDDEKQVRDELLAVLDEERQQWGNEAAKAVDAEFAAAQAVNASVDAKEATTSEPEPAAGGAEEPAAAEEPKNG